MGGGGFSMEPSNPLLDDFVLSLTRRDTPRVTFVATASGDAPSYVADFYRAFGARGCHVSDIGLFDRRIADLRAHVLAQDVVYVGGGNTASLLAAWRAHGLDRALVEAWHAGANESVTDCSNQQFIPALMPASTTPACQASTSTRSRPCARHAASRLAVFPPPT